MKLDLQFVLTVGLISLVVSIFITPLVVSLMKGKGLEGFDDGRVKWDGDTLTLNGNVKVNGSISGQFASFSLDGTNKNAIMLYPSTYGTEGPYIRFYDKNGKPNVFLMVGRNDSKTHEWDNY